MVVNKNNKRYRRNTGSFMWIDSTNKPSINLSLGASKSPRNFFQDGFVGLGIVAAMNDPAHHSGPAAPGPAILTRSEPIPIVSATCRAASKLGGSTNIKVAVNEEEEEEMEMELSESYTCVISRVGNGDSVKKTVYFDHGDGVEDDGIVGDYWVNSGVFYQSPPPPPLFPAKPSLPASDFLERCYLCRKSLSGLDIFMYRGEKAFCSAECRCQQIMGDEHHEKCGSEVLKPFDCSVSPCSAPLVFAAA